MTLIETSLQSSLEELINFETPLKEYQKMALDKLQSLGFPKPKDEHYRTMRLKELLGRSYQKASLEVDETLIAQSVAPFKDSPYLVVYNGQFLPRYSSFKTLHPKVIIKPIYDAALNYGVFFQNILQNWIEAENDPFSLLNLSLAHEGVFIYVSSNVQEEKPLLILEIQDSKESELSAPLFITSLGKGSKLNLIHHVVQNNQSRSLNVSNYFYHLEENSNTNVVHFPQAEKSVHFGMVRAEQKQCSKLQVTSSFIHPYKTRFDLNVNLRGKEAFCELFCLNALQNQDEMHTNILVKHHDEHGHSRQLVKNLYDDESLGSFEGKIYICQKAQKTNAYQLNQNCLLSDLASSYSKPNLEIFADDVKASHGSTTGQMDKEHLFYLQSRGLSKKEAISLLLRAFCLEVIEKVTFKEIQNSMLNMLSNYFEKKND